MKTKLLSMMALCTMMLMPVGEVKAQGTTETYDFGSWTKKSAVNQTLNLESLVTSSTGKTVYLLENFFDKDGSTLHSLNGRFAFEKSADTNPYGWTKFEGYATSGTVTDELMTAGLHLKNKNLTISILNLKAGDVVTVWHNSAVTAESTEGGLYITSTNVSYDTANGAKVSTGKTKTAGNALVSGTPYTMMSDGTFDFTWTETSDLYLRKVTIKTVGTNGIHIGSTGYATFSNTSAVSFSGTGVKVYWASAYEDGNVTFTEITDGQVPANVGVLLKATPGNYTYATGTSTTKYNDNLLKNIKDDATKVKVPETADGKTTTNYLLAYKDGVVGFYKVDAQKTGLGGKAYLSIVTDEVSPAREGITMAFDDETAHINTLTNNSCENGNVYNLNGQRVARPANGLYIVNGKKLIIK